MYQLVLSYRYISNLNNDFVHEEVNMQVNLNVKFKTTLKGN